MIEVHIAGIGPGNPELLTGEVRQLIDRCTLLIGNERMIEPFAAPGKRLVATTKPAEILKLLEEAASTERAAVLVSGDVGFYSLAQSLEAKLPAGTCHRHCGISSLSYFAARLHMPWQDAVLISMHGRTQNLVDAVRYNKKVFCLTGGIHTPQSLCQLLCRAGLAEVTVHLGENLSYPEERLQTGAARDMQAVTTEGPAVLMICNDEVQARPVPGLADTLFLRGKTPMTKQEVRSISLAKLQPRPDSVIYDIGAGTGSCSVELAVQAYKGTVYAIEKNPLAYQLLKSNIAKFSLSNVNPIAGGAPEAMAELPAPDLVFIGGSGGNLAQILDSIYEKNRACRIVINAITIETLAQTTAYYKEKPLYTLDISQVSVSRAREAGPYHLMMAQNPVYIMTAALREGL